jgi:phospholipid transport system transporter-binding protein
MTTVPAAVPDRNSGPGSFEITAGADGRSHVRGSLTFSTARRARAEGLQKFRECGAHACEVDCSGIIGSDSAGLTVLLEWLALAKRDGRSLRYVNLPVDLLALAKISEVDGLLQHGV